MMETDELQQFVVVLLGEERYAIHISEIYEIIKMQAITAVPKSQLYLEGITNLRGQILPVINLRKRFLMQPAPQSKHMRIVVAKHREELVGIVVDAVEQVTVFDEIQQPADSVATVDRSFLQGIGVQEEEIMSILSVDHVLAG